MTVSAVSALSIDFEAGGYHFSVNGEGSTVTLIAPDAGKYEGDADLTFEITDGTAVYTLTGIGDSAFENSGVTSVTLPATVTSIGSYTFQGCTELAGITLPDGITEVGTGVFMNCSALAEVILPQALHTLPTRAFSGCEALTALKGEYKISEVGERAFSGCKMLQDFRWDGLTGIGKSAFTRCSSLAEADLTDAAEIGDYAFEACTGLKRVELPEGIATIPAGMFRDCTSLDDVTLPATLQHVEEYAFSNCRGISSLTLPGSLRHIGVEAFNACSGMSEIKFAGNGLTIGERAFSHCPALTKLDFFDVTEIGEEAFLECKSLGYIGFSHLLREIGQKAFYGCESLKSILADAWEPPTIYINTFDYATMSGGVLYVSPESYENYRQAPHWQYFSQIDLFKDSPFPSGVETMIENAPLICISGYTLTVKGYNGDLRVFNPAGIEVASARIDGEDSIELPGAGIYIIEAGGFTQRIIAK